MPAVTTAGPIFHASQLAGAVSQQIPTISYAFATNNPDFFGVDATYSASGIVSLYTTITPLLQPPGSVPPVYCTPFAANSPQSLKCNALDRSLEAGEYTVYFNQCPPTANQVCQTTYVDGAVTFSVVPAPFTTVTPTVTTISVTLTSGTTDTTTTTTIFPASTATVTSYESTVTSVQTSTTSLTGTRAPVTVTGTCPAVTTASKPANCNHDNCLRALLGKTSSASAFCATFTTGSGHKVVPSVFASSCSSVSSRLTSACACLSTSNGVAKPRRRQHGHADLGVEAREPLDVAAVSEEERLELERRGLVAIYGGPDYTFSPGQYSDGTVTAGGGTATVTVGTVPATTTTDPGAITTSGTSTSVVDVTTTTITVVTSTVDSRTASTVTVPPANCGSSSAP